MTRIHFGMTSDEFVEMCLDDIAAGQSKYQCQCVHCLDFFVGPKDSVCCKRCERKFMEEV